MPEIQFRISDNDPYVYMEPTTAGSVAVGTDDNDSNKFKVVMSDATSDLDPGSGSIATGTCSISIDPTVDGNIEFCPKGSGQTNFARGSVAIEGQSGTAGNLLMNDTSAGGLSGVIEFDGNRFIHNYGTNNTFVGELAGNFSSTGTENTAVGTNALNSNTTATGHTAIGFNTLTALTSGIQNTAVGYDALASATSANQNTAVGYESLTNLTSPGIGGGLNAAYGNASLRASTLGRFNTAIGCQALVLQNGNGTNDINNVAVGCEAGSSMTSGKENTLVGALVANSLVNGDYNVIVGELAASQFMTNESSNIILGGRTGTTGDNNTIRIGAQGTGPHQQNKCFIAGINGTSVTAAGSVVVSSTGQLGSSSAMATTWNDVTGTSASMAVNNGYVADNAGLVTLTLPSTAAFGSRIEIVGKGSGGWTIAQNAGQTIHFNSTNTTTGFGGSLSSTQQYNCVELICVTANTDFVVKDSSGNLTIV